MKFDHEDLGNLKHKITVAIDEAGFRAERRKLARKYSTQVRIPGFRPGNAPIELVLKAIGPNLEYEVREGLISRTFAEAVEQFGLKPSTEPKFDMVSDASESLTFTAEFEVFPEVDLQNYMEVEVTAPAVPEVTDEAVEERIAGMLKSMSRFEEKPAEGVVEDGDMAEVTVTMFDASGNEMKADHNTRVMGGDDDEPVEGVGRQILGMKGGEEKSVSGRIGRITARGLKVDQDAVGTVTAKVKVDKVRGRKLPDLTPEFVKAHGDVETVEEFRAMIRKQLDDQRTAGIKDQIEELILEKICENNPFEIGERTVERLAEMAEKEARDRVLSQLPPDKREELGKNFNLGVPREQSLAEARKNLTRSIVLETIADKEGIKVTDEDVDARIKETADSYNMPVPQVRAILGEERLEQLERQLRVSKTMDLLTRYAVVKPAEETTAAADEKVSEKKPAKKSSRAAKDTEVADETTTDEPAAEKKPAKKSTKAPKKAAE